MKKKLVPIKNPADLKKKGGVHSVLQLSKDKSLYGDVVYFDLSSKSKDGQPF